MEELVADSRGGLDQYIDNIHDGYVDQGRFGEVWLFQREIYVS